MICNLIVTIMIAMSGIMAAIVLLNLMRIQINQKKKELLIMRINGFSFGETAGYILRENVITTSFGLVLGVIMGIGMSYFNMRMTDSINVQMVREPSLISCVVAVLITILFASIIQFIALSSIKKFNLKDI